MSATSPPITLSESRTHAGLLRAMLRAFMTVAALTLLAKIVSFLKDRQVASSFGISAELDAFVIAFGLHAFIVALLCSGLPEAFLPQYAEALLKKPRFRAERFAVQCAGVHLLTLGLLATALYLLRAPVIALMAKGADAATRLASERALAELLPFFFCFGLASMCGTWLRAGKSFVLAAAAPMLVPVCILAGLLRSGAAADVGTLTWGTNVGSALYLAVMLLGVGRRLPLKRRAWLQSCVRHWEPKVQRVVRTAGPYMLAAGVLGSTVLVDQAMAAWLGAGSVSLLSYAEKITSMILALTAVAATETLFPFYADAVAQQDWPALRKQLKQTIGIVLAAAVPLVSLLIWQAPLIVQLMFQRGQFSAVDTQEVAQVLRYSALQIPFYITGILLSKVLVSLQSRWFSLVMATAALVLNALLNWQLMQHMGVAGIALATALVNAFCAVVLGSYVSSCIRRAAQLQEDSP